jgi:hypothetical protein
VPITHAFTNPQADGADTTVTRPSDWNASHTVAIAANKVLVGTGASSAEQYPTGYEFDYVERTSNVSVTATASATGDVVVTGTSIAYDGSTVVMVEFFAPQLQSPNVAGDQLILSVFDGSTDLGILGVVRNPSPNNTSTGAGAGGTFRRRMTPSAASHSYIIKAWLSSAGTGTVGAGGGGTDTALPAFIRITKV